MFGVHLFSIVMSSLSFLTSFGLKSGFCFSLDIRTWTPLGIPFPYFTWGSDFLLRRHAFLGGNEEISFLIRSECVYLSLVNWDHSCSGSFLRAGHWFLPLLLILCLVFPTPLLNHSSMAYYFLWTHGYVCLQSEKFCRAGLMVLSFFNLFYLIMGHFYFFF